MEWIDTNKDLPEHCVNVFIKQGFTDEILIGWLDVNMQVWKEQCESLVIHGDAWAELVIAPLNTPECFRVTHWLPMSALPAAPKD